MSHMAIIVDGKAISEEIEREVASCFAELVSRGGAPPRVAVVEFGEHASAGVYTRQLQRAFDRVGVATDVHGVPAGASLASVRGMLGDLCADPSLHGIQIQTPLPREIALHQLADAIDPAKDLDGIHPENLGRLAQGRPAIVPATPQAGLEILDRYAVDLEGAHAVVIGRSLPVGRPMALLLIQRNATVTVCHTGTRELAAICREAEVLLVAAGRPGLVRPHMVRPKAAVIDFGVNVVDGRVVGDVDPSVAEVAALFTPVPGGTGPVTTAMLLRNALSLYRRAVGIPE